MLREDTRIYIAGHRGMVGSAIYELLRKSGYTNLIARNHHELDLRNQAQVNAFMSEVKPEYIVLAAAKVGGIHANNEYPAEFIYDNLMMEANIINAAYMNGCNNLLLLGSSCIYPKLAPQPMAEDALLTGTLEPTNEPYAIAKIAGIKLCESYNRQYGTDYRSVMPTNLYGPNDNFHPDNSHVIPALIRRFHYAKIDKLPTLTCWGTGSALREFLHVKDMAKACLQVMKLDKHLYNENTEPMLSHINIGTGVDVTIKELAEMVALVTEYTGSIEWDTTKPDGSPRKLMDIERIKRFGWSPDFDLRVGLTDTYSWFVANEASIRQ